MLYQKTKEPRLEDNLFKNPTSEYRGMPFWAWNTKLDLEELEEQIDVFREMGFGGFHMHVRQGLETEYLGREFMDAVKGCTQKAKEEQMYACLYDEDRWPSGVAGGEVTKDKWYRMKYLTMTVQERTDDAADAEEALNEGKSLFLAAFDVTVDKDGYMTGYRRIGRGDSAQNKRYFFADVMPGGEARFNYQTYVDALSKDAIDCFIGKTYETFQRELGDEFGKTIPVIFTDEPQTKIFTTPTSGFSTEDAITAWTTDFADTYFAEYGESIIDRLPEVHFAMHGDGGAKTRYQFYRHLSERFNRAYMDNIGKWCEENGIMFTGHVLGEDWLFEMCLSNADAMRAYKNMQLPGIDMLCDDRCFTTAVQCRSAVRQYGREGMLSELYGVTGWDYDFRGHKFQGDWQACLGVTLRVPHLAWQTMKGEGKRDYPASIFYQSPWYKEYKYVEDHFARVNTALTRGSAEVKTAVIHPVETYWVYKASDAETKYKCEELENHFHELSDWLLTGCVDYDYIAESLLEDLCSEGSAPLKVGKCSYETIIVADCVTLRPYTLKVLREFKGKGGNLIFMGNTPYMSLGVTSEEAKAVTEGAVCIPHSKAVLYELLSGSRDVMIKKTNGIMTDNMLYTLRGDGDDKWLFIAHSDTPQLPHTVNPQETEISVKGIYKPVLYHTLNGDIEPMPCRYRDGWTVMAYTFYDNDSLLVKLEKAEGIEDCGCEAIAGQPGAVKASNGTEQNGAGKTASGAEQTGIGKTTSVREYAGEVKIFSCTDYTLEEPNVLVLDMAQYSVDGEAFGECEEILRVDDIIRKKLGFSSRRTKVVQPYAIKDVPEDHTLKLRFTINSEKNCTGCHLAMENPHKACIALNGITVDNTTDGWYVDKYIQTVALPMLRKGENILEIIIPFGLRTDLENCFLLGKFGTVCRGSSAYITDKPEKLYFGNVVNQGLAFYGGNIEYDTEFTLDKASDVEFEISYYRGALIKVFVDGTDRGNIAFSPFKLRVDGLNAGKHKVKFVLYGNRYNTFSALHTLYADKKRVYLGPDYWRSDGDGWAYEYQSRPMGILKTPILRIFK